MLYYETFSVQSLLILNQMHTTVARLPGDLARRTLRATDQREQAQRAGAYILLEKMIRKYTDRFRSNVEGIVKPEFNSFFDAHSPIASLRYDSYGKPYFEGHDNATVSISHANYLVACALVLEEGEEPAAPVGIDVQNVDYDLDRAQRISARYFSEGEKELLSACGEDAEEFCRLFTRIWTRKEAYLKFLGVGLSEISRADTVHPEKSCLFEESEQLLTYLDERDKQRKELYYITVCTEPDVEIQAAQEG